jgi:hypothetical protein
MIFAGWIGTEMVPSHILPTLEVCLRGSISLLGLHHISPKIQLGACFFRWSRKRSRKLTLLDGQMEGDPAQRSSREMNGYFIYIYSDSLCLSSFRSVSSLSWVASAIPIRSALVIACPLSLIDHLWSDKANLTAEIVAEIHPSRTAQHWGKISYVALVLPCRLQAFQSCNTPLWVTGACLKYCS